MAVAVATTKRTVPKGVRNSISRSALLAELDAAERRIQNGHYKTEKEMWAHERSLRARLLGK